jgi:hypothetical protein
MVTPRVTYLGPAHPLVDGEPPNDTPANPASGCPSHEPRRTRPLRQPSPTRCGDSRRGVRKLRTIASARLAPFRTLATVAATTGFSANAQPYTPGLGTGSIYCSQAEHGGYNQIVSGQAQRIDAVYACGPRLSNAVAARPSPSWPNGGWRTSRRPWRRRSSRN